jgi:cystathionine beta-lyase
VGRVWREDELRRLGEICLARGVTIVSDEIHMDFERPGHRHVPLASLSPELAQATVTLTSASKTFNLAGLQAANAIAPNQGLRRRLKAAIAATGYGEPNVLALEATRAAYTAGASWLDALLEYIEGNWAFLRDFLAARIPALRLVEAEGTYLAWIDCRALGMDAKELERFMLEDAKLWLDQGDMFGAEGEGFVRINIATQRATLRRALEQLESAVNGLSR